MSDMITDTTAQQPTQQLIQPIGKEQVNKARETLEKYKRGKKALENKIVKNEKWWKMRHWEMMQTEETKEDPKPASGWLFNTIISKHADYMDAYPSSDILPREAGDVEEAKRLTSIIPVVMEQNGYKNVYSDESYYKLKNGTGVYGIFWDKSKLNGLGDITIKSMDILSLFWEPGVKNIQDSQNMFSVELVNTDVLKAQYPDAAPNISGDAGAATVTKYTFDDNIDTSGKSTVIDWYYHKLVNGKKTLQYVKFTGDVVLYATENDTEIPTAERQQAVTDEMGNPATDETGNPITETIDVPTGQSMAERGLYDHGKYPFVFDVLFPEAGLPVGLGFIDVCKNAQASIDIYNNCFEKNVQYVATPRYLVSSTGGLHEEEFKDPNNLIVHTDS